MDGCQRPNPNSRITHQFTEATLAIARNASITDAQRKPPTQRGHCSQSARPSGGGEQDPPAGALRPAPRSARLPRAQVQLSLMALYLLPDASFCSFLRISSILTFAGGRPQTARGAHTRPGGDAAATATRPRVPRLPLRSPRSDPARRLMMNHARSMQRPRQARSPARRPARRVRCAQRAATATATAGWGSEAATRPWPPRRSRGHGGSRKRGGGRPGLARRLGVGRARPKGASGCGRQRAGRGLVAAPATPPSGAGGVGAARPRLAELPAPGGVAPSASRRPGAFPSLVMSSSSGPASVPGSGATCE